MAVLILRVDVANAGPRTLSEVARLGLASRSDVAIASVLGVAIAVETASLGGGWMASVIACLPAVALVWRRTLPWLTPTAVLLLMLFAWSFDRPETVDTVSQVLVWVVGAFAAGAHATRRAAVAGLAYWSGVATVWMVLWGDDLADLAFELVLVTAPWVAGVALRRKREQAEGADRRADSAAAQAATAIADERARIARELHDVVAHAVGMMVVQAGAASQLLDQDPARARRALDTVQQTGRLAVDELARMLGLLRMQVETTSPLPSLSRVSELISDIREAGTDVSLRCDGDLGDLPAALDATAYRILQEALTNVVKHAPGATAQVRLLRSTDHIEIEVGNARASDTPQQGGTGHGLLGIGERAAVFGGHLRSGPTADGGYRLNVWLPINAAAQSRAAT
jgi:signal transduction histidine kinase